MKRKLYNIGVVLIIVIAGMTMGSRANAQAPVQAGCNHQTQTCVVLALSGEAANPQVRVTWNCRDAELDNSCSVRGRVVPEGGQDGIPVARLNQSPMILVQGRPIGSVEGTAFTSCDIACIDRTGTVPRYDGHGDLCGEARLLAYNNLGEAVWAVQIFEEQANEILSDCANNINNRIQALRAQQQADRAAADLAQRQRDTQASLSPLNRTCHFINSQPYLNIFSQGTLTCQFNCANQCTIASTSNPVFATCDPAVHNCNLTQIDITSGQAMCQQDLDYATLHNPNCNVPPGQGQPMDTGITNDDLNEGGQNGQPWKPSGGDFGPDPREADAGSSPAGEGGVGAEDLPPGGAGNNQNCYSQNCYAENANRKAAENLRQAGNNPTPAQRDAAKYKGIADARTDANLGSAQIPRDAIVQAVQGSDAGAANMKDFSQKSWREPRTAQYGTHNLQSRSTASPRPTPDNNRTPSMKDETSAQAIGEDGKNGRNTGDPVINGHFCFDKVFGKENTQVGPPVEVSARYCSYASPSSTPSGALGPGWSLNVESQIIWALGSVNLAYQDPQGNMVNFKTTDPALTPDSLKNSCTANVRYGATFYAVGKPLLISADVRTTQEDCHKISFKFTLTDAEGNKSTFERVINLSNPYPGTKEFETKFLLHNQSKGPINSWSIYPRGAEALSQLDIPRYVEQAKDRVRSVMSAATIVWYDNDPGPLGMYLLANDYADHRNMWPADGRDWANEQVALPGGGYARMVSALSLDIGFFTAKDSTAPFLSYALPGVIFAPVTRWEDAAGNATTIQRKTYYQKYYVARVEARGFIDQKIEVGPLQRGQAVYHGNNVDTYSYDRNMVKEVDNGVSYTMYETLLPRQTDVTVANGSASIKLSFKYSLEKDISMAQAFKKDELFPAPIADNRTAITVYKPRPILFYIDGVQTDANFRYGFVSRAGVCNPFNNAVGDPTSIAYNGHMAFFENFVPSELPAGQQYSVADCLRSRQAMAGHELESKDLQGNFYFAGPMILTTWIPPNPNTGASVNPFDATAVKPEYFLYKPANPQADELKNIQYPLYYPLMSETGFLNAWPTGDAEAVNPFNVDRTAYITNTYNNRNLVESHRLGDTGAIQYTYETISYGGGRQRYMTNVISRGGVSESFEFDGPPGSGQLISRTMNPSEAGGRPALTTQFEYVAQGQTGAGNMKTIRYPDGRETNFKYGEGIPQGFAFYAGYSPTTIEQKGTNRASVNQTLSYDADGRALGFYQKVATMTLPAPNSEAGNETITTQLRYDYQEAALNPCNVNKPQGNLVKTIYPDGTFESWKHNKKGQPIYYRNRFGVETTYSYFGTGEGCGQ